MDRNRLTWRPSIKHETSLDQSFRISSASRTQDRGGIETYFMTCMPGKTWLESYLWDKWDPKMNVEATKSLGRIPSRGLVLRASKAVVNSEIKGGLNNYLN